MFTLLKNFVHLSIKARRLKLIDKECDKYLKLKKNLEVQRRFVLWLCDEYEKDFGEQIAKDKESD